MQENKFIKIFRFTKMLQLCILFVMEIAFLLISLCNSSLREQLYSRGLPLFLCIIIWILFLFHLSCLLYDFYKLRAFTMERHALNKVAYLDNLTGIPNRHGLDTIFSTYDTPESLETVGCCIFTIDNLFSVNEKLGRQAGDSMLLDFSRILERVGDPFGTVGRNNGNEFLAVINYCTDDTLNRFLTTLNQEIEGYNEAHPHTPIVLRKVCLLNSEEKFSDFSSLLTVAYSRLRSLP